MKKLLLTLLLLTKFAHADSTTLPPPIDPYLATGYITAEPANLGALHYKVSPFKRRLLSLSTAILGGSISLIIHW